MTVTYPLTFPTQIKFASVTPTLQFVNSATKSPYSGERQAFRWPGEWWMLDFITVPCVRATAEEWLAFANKLAGAYGTFLMGDPSAETPRGIGGGTPLVRGAGQTGNTLDIDGCPPGTPGWMLKGDYFQLGTGSTSRMYKLYEDANVDSNGRVTLQFAPALRTSPADNAALVIQAAKSVFNLDSNSVTWSVDINGHYRYSFKAVESL